jgi:hypothetical protein
LRNGVGFFQNINYSFFKRSERAISLIRLGRRVLTSQRVG